MPNHRYVSSCTTVLVLMVTLVYVVVPPSFTSIVYGEEASHKWVIMMYIPADNSYEADYNKSYVGEVLNEITSIPYLPDSLKITVFLDTCKDTCKIYSIVESDDGVELVLQEDLGECNTGDPRVLEHFINYTFNTYEGEYYGLFIIDHSNSWLKEFNHIHFISLDENPGESNYGRDYLNFSELVSAISQYDIDVLFFDVDHYLSIDSYLELSQETRVSYVVGSPLHVYGPEYKDLFMELSNIVDSATPRDLAELIVNTTSVYNVDKTGFVLSAFQLNSSITSLYTQFVQEIAYLFRTYPDKMVEIFDTVLKNTTSYYTPLPRIYVDLGVFINGLQEAVSQDPCFNDLSTIVSKLYSQLNDSRISYSSHNIFSNCTGLALYLPISPYDYLKNRVWFTNSFTNIGSLLWLDMLSLYYSTKYPELDDIEIEFMAMYINDSVLALISSSINKKPVDLEEINVALYNVSSGSLTPIKKVDDVERIKEGIYIADLGLSGNISSNIVVEISVRLAYIHNVYYYQLDTIGLYHTLDVIADEIVLLKTNMLYISENVSALKTVIGEVKTSLDNVNASIGSIIDTIKFLNNSIVEIILETNKTIYGRLILLENVLMGEIALLRTNILCIGENVSALKTVIGEVETNLVDSIEFLNNSIVKIILETNKTIYGHLILLEEGIAKIKTDIGDLYIDLNVLRNNVTNNMGVLDRKVDKGIGKMDLLHYITSFIVVEVGLLFSIIYSRKHSLVS